MNMFRAILVCCLIARLYSLAQADDRRDVRLDGQPNFRDLGGYKTSDGRTVKSGLMFRSGELWFLNAPGATGVSPVLRFEHTSYGEPDDPSRILRRQRLV